MSSQQDNMSTNESVKSEEFFQSLVGEYKTIFDDKSENFMEILEKEKEETYKH